MQGTLHFAYFVSLRFSIGWRFIYRHLFILSLKSPLTPYISLSVCLTKLALQISNFFFFFFFFFLFVIKKLIFCRILIDWWNFCPQKTSLVVLPPTLVWCTFKNFLVNLIVTKALILYLKNSYWVIRCVHRTETWLWLQTWLEGSGVEEGIFYWRNVIIHQVFTDYGCHIATMTPPSSIPAFQDCLVIRGVNYFLSSVSVSFLLFVSVSISTFNPLFSFLLHLMRNLSLRFSLCWLYLSFTFLHFVQPGSPTSTRYWKVVLCIWLYYIYRNISEYLF